MSTPKLEALPSNENVIVYGDGQTCRINHTSDEAAAEYAAGTPPVDGTVHTGTYQGAAQSGSDTVVTLHWDDGTITVIDCNNVEKAIELTAVYQAIIDTGSS